MFYQAINDFVSFIFTIFHDDGIRKLYYNDFYLDEFL